MQAAQRSCQSRAIIRQTGEIKQRNQRSWAAKGTAQWLERVPVSLPSQIHNRHSRLMQVNVAPSEGFTLLVLLGSGKWSRYIA
jgi:hypothetical protein